MARTNDLAMASQGKARQDNPRLWQCKLGHATVFTRLLRTSRGSSMLSAAFDGGSPAAAETAWNITGPVGSLRPSLLIAMEACILGHPNFF